MSGDHFLNLQPGTVVNGRYEVVKCLGTGSMGMVYACRHNELAGHMVAMKVLFSEVARDEVAAARFRNEIVASYGVSHPNVVRAYEYFRDGDLIAFTMEYIGGGDLADRISSDEDISIEEIVEMLCQMASGVQAIHDAGIIHRDLKPENILLTAHGGVKITDFGIARRTGTGPKLTEHGGVVGTIDYVSPEYLERGQVDERSDIYALGVLAFEMITSEAPFKGKSVIETMTLRLRTDPESPDRLRPECPVALSNIVLKAMARDPEERYQSAGEMLEDLEALRAGGSIPLGSPRSSDIEIQAEVVGDVSDSELEMSAQAQHHLSEARAPTTEIRQGVSYTKDNTAELLGPVEDYYEVDSPLESVLGPGESSVSEYSGVLDAQSVEVSQSGLSSERIKELSLDLYQPRTSVLRRLFSWVFVLFVGFGVGLLLLKHYSPHFFGVVEQDSSRSYLDE